MFKIRLLFAFLILTLIVACNPSNAIPETVALPTSTIAPTAMPVESTITPTKVVVDPFALFIEQLQTAVADANYSNLQTLMSNPFLVAGWRSEGRVIDPAQAISQFQDNTLPAPTNVLFTGRSIEELTAMLGQSPASLLGPDANVVAALHSTGWGESGTDEAILFVTEENGTYSWSAFLYTFGSFEQSENPMNEETIPVIATDVQFVMAQQNVIMYSGPDTTYGEIGNIADGQTARVTGKSQDGNWWRVICPDDTIGSCWITADPAFTLPTN